MKYLHLFMQFMYSANSNVIILKLLHWINCIDLCQDGIDQTVHASRVKQMLVFATNYSRILDYAQS